VDACALGRDLKPANILLDEAREQIKICDFGEAKDHDAGQTVKGVQ